MQPQPGAEASKRESKPSPCLRLAAIAPALSCELIHQSDLERLAGWIAPLRALELKASAVEQTQRRRFAGIHERGDSFDLVRLEGMREQRLELIVDGLRKPHRLTKHKFSAVVGQDADKLRNGTPVREGQ